MSILNRRNSAEITFYLYIYSIFKIVVDFAYSFNKNINFFKGPKEAYKNKEFLNFA